MTTSSSTNFSVSRNDLIEAALKQIGVLDEGGTASATQLTEGALILNMLVKARMSDGMPLWALKIGYFLPVRDTSSYTIGANAHAVTSFTTTTTSAAALSGATSVVLTSVTGVSDGYAIGIEEDSTIFWTTVSGAPSGSTVTLASALTDDVSSGARVYVYNTANRMGRPLRVISAYMAELNEDNEIGYRFPLRVITKDQYFSLGNPTAEGTPNQVHYDPDLDTGVFYVYPRFLVADQMVQVTYHRPYDDFDSSTDTPDFPQEWYLSLMLDLAALMGPKYGVSIEERRELKAEAKMWRDLALENGTEYGSYYFQPELSFRAD